MVAAIRVSGRWSRDETCTQIGASARARAKLDKNSPRFRPNVPSATLFRHPSSHPALRLDMNGDTTRSGGRIGGRAAPASANEQALEPDAARSGGRSGGRSSLARPRPSKLRRHV